MAKNRKGSLHAQHRRKTLLIEGQATLVHGNFLSAIQILTSCFHFRGLWKLNILLLSGLNT